MKKGQRQNTKMTLNELPENMMREIAHHLPPNQRIKPTSGTISVSIPLYEYGDPSNRTLPAWITPGIGPPVIAFKLDGADNKTRILFEDLRLARERNPEYNVLRRPQSYVRNILSELYIPKHKATGNVVTGRIPKNSDRVLATKPLTQMSIKLKKKQSYRPQDLTDFDFTQRKNLNLPKNLPNGSGRSVKYDSYEFNIVDKRAEKIKTRSQTEQNRRTRTATNFMQASKSIRNALQSRNLKKIRDGVNWNPRGGLRNGFGILKPPKLVYPTPPVGRPELDKLIQHVRGMDAWQNRLNRDYETHKDHRSLLTYEDFVKNETMKYYNKRQTEYNRKNTKSIPMTTASRRRKKIEQARGIVPKQTVYNNRRMNYPKSRMKYPKSV